MPQGSLRDMMVVEPLVVLPHGVQVITRVEVCGVKDFAYSAVEALHHAVDLRMARRVRWCSMRSCSHNVSKAWLSEGLRSFCVKRSVKAWSLSVSSLVMMNGAFSWRFMRNRKVVF